MKRAMLLAGLAAVPLFAFAALAQEAKKPAAPEKLAATLAEKIETLLARPECKTAHWGLLAVDADDGRVVYQKNSDQLFAPASVTKLFTVAAALDVFGPDHRFVTPVVRTGELREDGTLTGDLILIATGDLTLGGRTRPDGSMAFADIDHTYANGSDDAEATPQDPSAGLMELANRIAQAGVKRLAGDVLIDDRLFDKGESSGSGPTKVCPIQINDNVIDVKAIPTEVAQPARVETRPKAPFVEVDALVETGPENGAHRLIITKPAPGRIVVRGTVAARRKPILRIVEVDDPASFARSLFICCLLKAGVKTDASSLSGNRLEALPPADQTLRLPQVATHTSPSFSEEAKLILKVSHNLHASTLPALLAAHQGQRAIEDGMLQVAEFLRKAKVDPDLISFGGGAGGARADFVSPRATVQLLRHMMTRPDFAAYEQALPSLGVDGTLHDAVPADSLARGKVRAKTGTYVIQNALNGRFLLLSKGLAGYVTTASGKKLVFAFFVNGAHLNVPGDAKREGKTLGKLAELLHEL